MVKKGQTRHDRLARESNDPIDVSVGAVVRKLRMARQITQADLGAYLGVSLQQIQKYEKGQNRMGASALLRAAECLCVSVEDLFSAALSGADPGDVEHSVLILFEKSDSKREPGVSDRELSDVLSNFAAIKDKAARSAVRTLLKRLRVLSAGI